MRACLVSLCLLISVVSSSQSAYKNVLIDAQKNAFEYPPCEPSIAINQTNPANVVAGAILNKVYVSNDSGMTWAESELTSSHGVFGDPAIISSSKGDFYYLHLSDPSGRGWSHPSLLDRIVCQRSTDGGKTWSDGGAMGRNGEKDQDKQWAATAPNGKMIYATWTQFDRYNSEDPGDSTLILFSCAKRNASKWSDPVRISELAGNCLDDDFTVEGAVPAAGTKGEVYVTWARGDSLFFDRSLDGGKTWMDQDIIPARIYGGWNQDIPGINRCNGMPVTMVDHSNSSRRGQIYVLYADTRNGEDDTDIWCISSADRGATWTAPVRVNDDGPGRHQFFPWLAVDPETGHLYAVFYDRRNHEGNATDVYLATSTDGGRSWENERISESPFTPKETVFFGDYNNISAQGGMVRPIWTRYEDGKLSVWTALIRK